MSTQSQTRPRLLKADAVPNVASKPPPGEPPKTPAPEQLTVASDAVNQDYAHNLANSQNRPRPERVADNRLYHERVGRRIYRAFIAGLVAAHEELTWRLGQLKPQLATIHTQLKQLKRFAGRVATKAGAPATSWTYAQFSAVVFVMFLAIANGTFSVSSVMLDSTTFSGQLAKTITVGLGFFLLPSLALSMPFHMLRKRPRYAKGYLGLLICGGMACGVLFAITWSQVYALENDNDQWQEVLALGMGTGAEDDAAQPWLLANANWLSLLAQILADILFAAAAKSYLTYLTWNYALFNRRQHQEDPEWQRLKAEESELVQQLGELQGELAASQLHLDELHEQGDEYVETVVAEADAYFQRCLDLSAVARQQRQQLADGLAAKEEELRQAREQLDSFTIENPGTHQQGDSHEATN